MIMPLIIDNETHCFLQLLLRNPFLEDDKQVGFIVGETRADQLLPRVWSGQPMRAQKRTWVGSEPESNGDWLAAFPQRMDKRILYNKSKNTY